VSERVSERVSEPVSERVSEVAEKATNGVRGSATRKPAPPKPKSEPPASAMSEVAECPEIETEIETESKAVRADARPPAARQMHLPERRADVVALAPASGAQDLVAHFVDRYRECGEPAPRRLVGHVARQVGELLRDGVSPPTIARALDLMLDKEVGPSVLPALVHEARSGPRRDREHPATAAYRLAHELRRQEEQA
jgi:hypothetical protein